MNKVGTLVIVLVVAILGIGAFVLMNGNEEDTVDTSTTSLRATDTQTPTDSSQTDQQDAADATDSQSASVVISEYAYSPAQLTVKKGTTVTWTNEDGVSHDVTPNNETDDFKASDLFGKGKSYSVTFNTVGSYSYYCSPHPYMQGTVTVVE